MKLLNQANYFERHDEGFVYRPTAFSAGYSVSADEKDRLFRALMRLERHILLEGFALIALIAGLFMAGIVRSPTPIAWFLLASIAAVVLLALTTVHRKRRLVDITLGPRAPNMPRLPIRQALTRQRPLLAKGVAMPLLRSVVALFVLAAIAVDALALYPIIAAWRAERFAVTAADDAAIEEMLALTLYNYQFWALVAAANVVLLACAGLLFWELRRLRALPEIEPPAPPAADAD